MSSPAPLQLTLNCLLFLPTDSLSLSLTSHQRGQEVATHAQTRRRMRRGHLVHAYKCLNFHSCCATSKRPCGEGGGRGESGGVHDALFALFPSPICFFVLPGVLYPVYTQYSQCHPTTACAPPSPSSHLRQPGHFTSFLFPPSLCCPVVHETLVDGSFSLATQTHNVSAFSAPPSPVCWATAMSV